MLILKFNNAHVSSVNLKGVIGKILLRESLHIIVRIDLQSVSIILFTLFYLHYSIYIILFTLFYLNWRIFRHFFPFEIFNFDVLPRDARAEHRLDVYQIQTAR